MSTRLMICWLVLGLTACTEPLPDATRTPAPVADSSGGTLEERGFEKVGEQRGVTVYQAEDPELIRIGAETRLPAPPSDVLEALLDYPKHPEVLERVAECIVLDRGPDWLIVYQHLRLPVIDDRDFTLKVTWGEEKGTTWIRYRTSRKGPRPREGIVRVTRDFGSWELIPTDGGKATLARYESNMDMAGSLPTWMSQSSAVDELPSLIEGIRKLLAARGSDGKCPG